MGGEPDPRIHDHVLIISLDATINRGLMGVKRRRMRTGLTVISSLAMIPEFKMTFEINRESESCESCR